MENFTKSISDDFMENKPIQNDVNSRLNQLSHELGLDEPDLNGNPNSTEETNGTDIRNKIDIGASRYSSCQAHST